MPSTSDKLEHIESELDRNAAFIRVFAERISSLERTTHRQREEFLEFKALTVRRLGPQLPLRIVVAEDDPPLQPAPRRLKVNSSRPSPPSTPPEALLGFLTKKRERPLSPSPRGSNYTPSSDEGDRVAPRARVAPQEEEENYQPLDTLPVAPFSPKYPRGSRVRVVAGKQLKSQKDLIFRVLRAAGETYTIIFEEDDEDQRELTKHNASLRLYTGNIEPSSL